MSDLDPQGISQKEPERISFIWIIYVLIVHSITRILIVKYSNADVMNIYTIMFILLQFVLVNKLLSLKRRDGYGAMNAFLVVEAFFCSLNMAIIAPILLLPLIEVNVINIFFAIITPILFIGTAYYFYYNHWAEYRYFVSN